MLAWMDIMLSRERAERKRKTEVREMDARGKQYYDTTSIFTKTFLHKDSAGEQ